MFVHSFIRRIRYATLSDIDLYDFMWDAILGLIKNPTPVYCSPYMVCSSPFRLVSLIPNTSHFIFLSSYSSCSSLSSDAIDLTLAESSYYSSLIEPRDS